MQHQLWVEGHQLEQEDSERVVEVKLDKEEMEESQEENTQREDDTQSSQGEEPTEAGKTFGESQEDKQEGQHKYPRTETQEESSEEDSENPPSGEKKDNSHSTLTSEEDSKAEQRPELVTKPLRPMPLLVDTPLPESSTAFDLEDPLGIKAMRVALATTLGSKCQKGPRKCKATTALKKLTPAIKLTRENAHLKL